MLEVRLKAKDKLRLISGSILGLRVCNIELESHDFYMTMALYYELTKIIIIS